MEYKPVNAKQTNGSSYRGEVTTSIHALIEAFGLPHNRMDEGEWTSLDNKTRAEWAFELHDGRIVTIYDYKENVPIHEVQRWHIGGKNGKGQEKWVKDVITSSQTPNEQKDHERHN